MTVSEKVIKYFKMALFISVSSIILIKATVSIILAFNLIKINSLTDLLPLSMQTYFKLEYLFRVGLAFSDLNFNLKTPIFLLSIFDILPLLSIILLLEINRITSKNRAVLWSLLSLLILYSLKYLGLFGMLLRALALNYNFDFILGINYLGSLLLLIALAQIITLGFFVYTFFLDLKIIKVE